MFVLKLNVRTTLSSLSHAVTSYLWPGSFWILQIPPHSRRTASEQGKLYNIYKTGCFYLTYTNILYTSISPYPTTPSANLAQLVVQQLVIQLFEPLPTRLQCHEPANHKQTKANDTSWKVTGNMKESQHGADKQVAEMWLSDKSMSYFAQLLHSEICSFSSV